MYIECGGENERRWKNAKRATELPQASKILGSYLVVQSSLTQTLDIPGLDQRCHRIVKYRTASRIFAYS